MPKKASKKRGSRSHREIVVPRNCIFCKEKIEPDYKKPEELAKYISDRAKILGKDRTGLCAKHQRRVAKAVKQARHLKLLPYIGNL